MSGVDFVMAEAFWIRPPEATYVGPHILYWQPLSLIEIALEGEAADCVRPSQRRDWPCLSASALRCHLAAGWQHSDLETVRNGAIC